MGSMFLEWLEASIQLYDRKMFGRSILPFLKLMLVIYPPLEVRLRHSRNNIGAAVQRALVRKSSFRCSVGRHP